MRPTPRNARGDREARTTGGGALIPRIAFETSPRPGSLRHATKGRPPARDGDGSRQKFARPLLSPTPGTVFVLPRQRWRGPEWTYTIFVTAAGPEWISSVLGRQPSVRRGTCGLWRVAQVRLYRICYRPKGGRGVARCDKGFVIIAIDAIRAVYNPCTKSTKLSSTFVDQVRRDNTAVHLVRHYGLGRLDPALVTSNRYTREHCMLPMTLLSLGRTQNCTTIKAPTRTIALLCGFERLAHGYRVRADKLFYRTKSRGLSYELDGKFLNFLTSKTLFNVYFYRETFFHFHFTVLMWPSVNRLFSIKITNTLNDIDLCVNSFKKKKF